MDTVNITNFDFTAELVKASTWTLSELIGAILDAQNTIKLWEENGMDASKYYDQISVYRNVKKKKFGC